MNRLSSRPRFLTRVVHWCVTHRPWPLIIASALLVVIAAGVSYLILNQPEQKLAVAQTAPKPKPAPAPVFYSPLTGNKVADEAATKQAVTAIMIENSPNARPQSGLKQAGVVYEAVAEGGITRFLTIHQENKPQLIGPVRSLRMYYVDWLAAYDASVAHVGGSAAALAEVRNGGYRDIDQFFNSGSYWRASDRYAPHNVYTSFERLDALNQAKGYTSSSFTGFARAEGKPVDTPTASQVTINISSQPYNTSYTYDKVTNTYQRFLGGAPHLDREDGQITPSVIVAMKVDMTRILEDGYRESINTIGSGSAVIFQNGTATEATWHKPDRKTGITFTGTDGQIIPLVRGQTWIAAVPNSTGSVSWQ